MNDNITIKKLFCDMLKFMISVMALCCSFSYFLKVVYSYAIEGFPLLIAVKYNFMHIYLLWIAGLAVWLTIKEKGLAFATALILFTSGYWLQIFDFNYVKDFMIGMYVPCSAGLIYLFEVMIRNEVLHVDSSN